MRTALERILRPAVAVVAAMTLLVAMTGTVGATEPAADEPEVSGSQTTTHSAQAVGDHDCDADEWHFVITQIGEDQYPASVSVSWDSGASGEATFWKYTGSTAHYVTTANLDVMVTGATADLPAEWTGQFNLSHGPCPAEDSPDQDESDEVEESDQVDDSEDETDETDDDSTEEEVLDDTVDTVDTVDTTTDAGDETDVRGDEMVGTPVIDRGPGQPMRPAAEQPTTAATPDVQVLGETTTRSALARTGIGPATVLAPFGIALLLLGFALRRSARRAAVH